MVKANDDLLGKGTDKELKKSLYVPRKIDKTKKLIAFTFDDGPLKGNTERVLAALEKNDAKSNIFHVRTECKLLSRDSQESLRVR